MISRDVLKVSNLTSYPLHGSESRKLSIQYSLKSIGTCRIRHSDEDDTACLVIDGKMGSSPSCGMIRCPFFHYLWWLITALSLRELYHGTIKFALFDA